VIVLRRARPLWTVLLFVLGLAACKGPGPAEAPKASHEDPAELGRQAFSRQDYAAAAPLFRKALEKDAKSLELHYKLAVSTSFLSITDEAQREFEWVVANAPEGSEEARIARQWLASLAKGDAPRQDSDDVASAGRTGDSGISGVVSWTEPGARPEPKRRMQVHLIALPGQKGTDEQRFTVRTDQDGRYVFTKIPAGVYKMTNVVAGVPQWRLRVTLAPGQSLTVNLDNSNSTSARDDFPGG